MKSIFRVFILITNLVLPVDNFSNAQEIVPDNFVDYKRIVKFRDSSYINLVDIDSFSIQWGNQILKNLNLNTLNTFDRASKIQKYIHENIRSTGKQPPIHDIIIKKNGNCWDHAIICVFLLRMAGIPARFAVEINLKHNVCWYGLKAKRQNCGLWGYDHNDHVWVLFYDGSSWQPLDSELDIMGLSDFIKHRWGKISPFPFKLLPYGPPFIIWEDTGGGFLHMRTITKQIWANKTDDTYILVCKRDWYEFLNEFENAKYENLEHNLFPKDKEKAIKRMSKKWF